MATLITGAGAGTYAEAPVQADADDPVHLLVRRDHLKRRAYTDCPILASSIESGAFCAHGDTAPT